MSLEIRWLDDSAYTCDTVEDLSCEAICHTDCRIYHGKGLGLPRPPSINVLKNKIHGALAVPSYLNRGVAI